MEKQLLLTLQEIIFSQLQAFHGPSNKISIAETQAGSYTHHLCCQKWLIRTKAFENIGILQAFKLWTKHGTAG